VLILSACTTPGQDPNDDDNDPGPPPPATFPDLTVRWLQIDPDPLTPHSLQGTVSFIVTNIGDAPAERTTTLVVLETETSPGTFEVVTALEIPTPAVDQGGAVQLFSEMRWDDYLPFGDHRITVSVDVAGELNQSDISNDRIQRNLRLPHPCADPGAPVFFADATLQSEVARSLSLSGSTVSCGELQNLTVLYAGYLGITDLTGIESATRLSIVDVVGSRIESLAPLTGLPSLTRLALSHVDEGQMPVIGELATLDQLHLEDSAAHDLTPLLSLQRLRELTLNNSSVHDIAPLSRLPEIRWLTLSENPITDLWPLAEVPNLASLTLRDLDADEWGVLQNLSTLTSLTVGWNANFEPEVLNALPESLSTLNVEGQGLSDLSFLASVPQLRTLSLYENQITDAAAVSALELLEYLMLAGNNITDVSFLTNLTDLYHVSLMGNRIGDISPLLDLESSRDDISIDLSYNCLDLTPGSPARLVLSELQARGITVWWEYQDECGSGG